MNHQGTLIRFAVPAAVLLYNPIPLFSFLVNESNKSIRLKSLLLNFIVAFDISTSKQCAMTLFNCISKQRRRRMPCTNCMVEYSRTRKEVFEWWEWEYGFISIHFHFLLARLLQMWIRLLWEMPAPQNSYSLAFAKARLRVRKLSRSAANWEGGSIFWEIKYIIFIH